MGDRRAAWAVTIGLSLAMLMVPAGFALLLSAQGGEAADDPARGQSTARSHTDRDARVTFHLRPGSLGMRMLRGAPPRTTVVRGREVRVLCGSVSGLRIQEARWPRGSNTLRIDLPPAAYSSTEFCALKRGRRGVARVVFP